MTLEMQFLLLPLDGTGGLRTVADSLCHAVQAETDAEQHKREDDDEEKFRVLGCETLHTRRALVEVQCLGKVLSCRHILLVTLLSGRPYQELSPRTEFS